MAKNDTKTPTGERMVCQNRRARHEYFIEQEIEAGLSLTGTEVKSLRQGRGSIQEAYVQIREGQAWLMGFHIPAYEQGNIWNVDPVRDRRLLLHRREIDKLAKAVERQGYTVTPLKVYFRRGYAKVAIGLARGKKAHDKRDDIKARDQRRDMDRAMRQNRDG